MVRRSKIKRRQRIFVACEGESEQGYTALLKRFADNAGHRIHIDAQVIPKAGDPLALAERAIAKLELSERNGKTAYIRRFLVTDTDWMGQDPDRDRIFRRRIEDNAFTLVRQNCCFEAFLLRHFQGHENDQPPDANQAMARLRDVWPAYRKGSSAQDLSRHLSVERVRIAAQNPINSDFSLLLQALGLLP